MNEELDAKSEVDRSHGSSNLRCGHVHKAPIGSQARKGIGRRVGGRQAGREGGK